MILPLFSPGNTLAHAQQNSPLSPLETRILLSYALGLTRIQLITQSEHVLDAAEAARLSELFGRRLMGEPIAYLVGQREFYGLTFAVTRDVLIPRPETELLVELALERLPQNGAVLDLGTGSGAVAVALAHGRPDAQVTTVDVSAAALALARRNAALNHVRVQFLQGDWYLALGAQDVGQFDLIVANPPYIVAGDPHLKQGDLRFEPIGALTDHGDGLSALRTIVAGAPARLKSGGWLLMEHGYDQAAAVRELLTAQGFCEVQSWRDLAGIERVSGARRA